MYRDTFSYDRDASARLRVLPSFVFDLVQEGDTLIPLQRGPRPSDHPSWEYAVEPGRVWNEATDNGMSRAALPFALIETNANCTHNGVLTFLFDGNGVVSDVAWQIASETCAYLQFDAWGGGRAVYAPGDDGAAAVAAFAQERTARMPTRPFSVLASDYPGIDIGAFAAPDDVNPANLTTFGVVANGVHYLGGCDTRAGPYPFCESLLSPSYSLAKSLLGGLGLMRMEMLHPGIMGELVSAHVPQCNRWTGVTLEHALDMTTGRYVSAADQADENSMTSSRFFISTTHAEKIAIACSLFPRREAPGRRWVYHTTDTYVLGAAMADVWRDRHGAEADFFDDVLVEGIYEPLHLSPTMRATRRTIDDARQPLTGWGLTLTRDDIAKLGAYLAAPPQGAPLVAPAPLAAALQRASTDRGLEAGGAALRYNNGFWAFNAQVALNCADPVWIPFLSGFGGVLVALMPNGVVYYFVSDGGDYRWARAARAANTIAPMCARTHP
ncbi:MAG: beta-lactamase family protein [Hyphomonadaceae bacterium JAD_PAG50586_4]|nr:MAG: beta-lactamase family protein [Hyphomonadaceae bacterium JAD_PAG50586_4]